MRILIIGAEGTIGTHVAANLSLRHEVVSAGRNSGDIRVDIASSASIEQMYKKAGPLHAVVAIAGEAHWGAFETMTEEDYLVGIRSKLMGQVNLVRVGQRHLQEGGSFTLTSGILAEDPVKDSAGPALVNGALHSFVLAAAQDLQRRLRINVVAAGVVQDAYAKYAPFFPGHNPVSMPRVVNAYCKSVEGLANGQIIRVY